VTAADELLGAAHAVAAAYDRIAADPRAGVWIELVDRAVALARARRVDERQARGVAMPLAGVTLAVKGNIDVEGIRTTAACPSFGEVPPTSARVVRTLEAAGAVVVGVTNLDQFATGLVGTRSPHGVCPNAGWPGLISGGSSSGSAAAVAAGHVDLALGTDTAGSGRVPAAATGIVGLKPTKGRLSTAGIVPACRSLDCVSVFARSVELAALSVDVATIGLDPDDPWSRVGALRPVPTGRPLRVGVPTLGLDDFDGDATSRRDHEAAVGAVVASLAGAARAVDLAPFLDAGRLLYEGGFVAERFDAVGEFVSSHLDEVDPVVGPIIVAAGDVPAWQLTRDRTELARLAAATASVWDEIDLLVVPSVPRIPSVAEVAAEPVSLNSMLGRYTNFVNLLDLCAITVPVGEAGASRPPASVTLIAPAWSDDLLVAAGGAVTGVTRGSSASRRTS
jgi:allophanate hydrolase